MPPRVPRPTRYLPGLPLPQGKTSSILALPPVPLGYQSNCRLIVTGWPYQPFPFAMSSTRSAGDASPRLPVSHRAGTQPSRRIYHPPLHLSMINDAPPARLTVTPSPTLDAGDNRMDDDDVANEDENGGTSSASRPISAKATARSEKRKKQRAGAKAGALHQARATINLKVSFFTYVQPDVFDAAQFKRGHPIVYDEAEMSQFDDMFFQRQLLFNFSERHASVKKKADKNVRISRNTEEDIIKDVAVHKVEASGFRELSRYILEDMMRATVGDRFLLCIFKSVDFFWEAHSGFAGSKEKREDIVMISGAELLCLSTWRG